MENTQNPNLKWIRAGKTGCNFATLFSKNPEAVGWKFFSWKNFDLPFSEDTYIVSILFEDSNFKWNKNLVRLWALEHGFYEENITENLIGLRFITDNKVSWVQYFGPDSHVVTRQAPQPMLMFTRKLNKSHYIKVGWKGILHLAHAWRKDISQRVYDLLWERSYKQTRKLLGHEPTIEEAAKTTFKN